MSVTKKIQFVLLLCLLVPSSAFAYTKSFSLYARSVLGDDKSQSIKVTTNIPFANLIFLKKESGYEARYGVYYRLLGTKGALVQTAVQRELVTAETYDDSRSRKYTSNSARSFDVAPGTYTVECVLRVKDTHLVFSNVAEVVVPNVEDAGVVLSKPRAFVSTIDSTRQEAVARILEGIEALPIEPKEIPSFVAYDRHPAFAFDIFAQNDEVDSLSCDLLYEVTNVEKLQVYYGKKRVMLAGSDDQFVVFLNPSAWAPGTYDFRVKAHLIEPNRAATSAVRFTLEYTDAILAEDFDATVEILSIIGEDEEIQKLKDATEEERGLLWAEFWKRRDQSPDNEENEALTEHFRRLRYVNTNFAAVGMGWRSDRGRIYLKYGEPDETNTRTDAYLQGHYLTWRYFSGNLTFVFYDRFGLGEYRLSTTNTF